MAIPDFQTLMLPVLRISDEGEMRIGSVVERVADQLGLTDDERAELLPSGRQATFANRVHWAKSYLGKAALIELTGRGRFRISQRGRDVLANPPERITIRFLEQFPEFAVFRGNTANQKNTIPDPVDSGEPAQGTPDELIRAAHEALERELAADLLQRIQAAPPAFFERLLVQLLVRMGYGGSAVQAGRALSLGRSGDGGVDGVIDQDHLGLDRVYIQAKRYSTGNVVGSGPIRDFFGALDSHKAAKGLFVTTSTFSPAARQTAEHLSKRIVLIDGGQLTSLMIRFEVGCRIEDTIHIKQVDEEFFE